MSVSVTCHVVAPFDRNAEGALVPGEAKEAPNAAAALRRAQALAAAHAGAVAFTGSGDPDSGEFRDGEVIATFGKVDPGALQG